MFFNSNPSLLVKMLSLQPHFITYVTTSEGQAVCSRIQLLCSQKVDRRLNKTHFKLSGKKIPPQTRYLFPSREPLQMDSYQPSKSPLGISSTPFWKKPRTSLRPGSSLDRERHQKHVNIQRGKQIVELQIFQYYEGLVFVVNMAMWKTQPPAVLMWPSAGTGGAGWSALGSGAISWKKLDRKSVDSRLWHKAHKTNWRAHLMSHPVWFIPISC